MGSNPHN
jgi:hypothetical protein